MNLDESENAAVEAAIAVCMHRGGFTYDPVPYFGPFSRQGGRYGITDVVEAAQYGYDGPPHGDTDPDPTDWEGRLPPAEWGWEDALFGTEIHEIEWKGASVGSVTVGGCLEEGHNIVVGDYGAWIDTIDALQRLEAEARFPTEHDPRVEAVLAAWSDCMAAAGHPGATHGEPVDVSRAAAVADATCNNSVGLASSWRTVEVASEWSVLAEYEPMLVEMLSRVPSVRQPERLLAANREPVFVGAGIPCGSRGNGWSGPGSNWRPLVFQTSALPTELPDRGL